ncbi:OmpA family protein [Spirosoma sp. HMF3257]|uniref:OmpA family protein n=1 Tax=Spirosoma telluris TaxID=2183553 RepID=A0A327NJ55_9BACT|nr:OmpA family protein [Spirosoma telluris]RAI75222.1 OmpA family protein [Spirosoma telluris]
MTDYPISRSVSWQKLAVIRYSLYCLFLVYSGAFGQQRPISPIIKQAPRVYSDQKPKPSILIIRAFAGDISKPLAAAFAIIKSRVTGKTERFALVNGRLEGTFTVSDELSIEVQADGYTSTNGKRIIELSPQGNRYEFDAILAPITISLTVWAVDRQTDKIIPGVRFTISGKATGATSMTLTSDSTTGQSKVVLPSKGVYVLSSSAKGYADFVKSIRLDSVQNEARFILAAKPPPAEKKPQAAPDPVAPAVKPVTKPVVTAPVATTAVSVSAVAAKPFGALEKGKPVRLNNLYFDQSSPVLRPESYAELDQLASLLLENPTLQIEIRGHTDNQGDFDLNVKLSRDRCQAVIDYLVSKGVAKNRLRAVGRGPIDSIAPNNSEESRKKNRRVEFVVI